MNLLLAVEQTLNGLQLGVLLFLVSSGLTLVFGIARVVNLAHASFFMLGGYFAIFFSAWTGSLLAGLLLGVASTAAVGVLVERIVIAQLYQRQPLEQLLATLGLLMFFNELAPLIWGPAGLSLALPPVLAGSITILPGLTYPAWRLVILITGLSIAALMALCVARTRIGMWIRASASNPSMAAAMGVNLPILFSGVFASGAALAGLAGILTAPLITVRSGMGDDILILAFVVIVVGGMGSVRGAFVAALVFGMLDSVGRAALPEILGLMLSNSVADSLAAALSSMLIYIAMAIILWSRPQGLFAEGNST